MYVACLIEKKRRREQNPDGPWCVCVCVFVWSKHLLKRGERNGDIYIRVKRDMCMRRRKSAIESQEAGGGDL